MRGLHAGVLGAALAMAIGGSAWADQITYDGFDVVNSNNVYIQYPNPGGPNLGPFGSGQIDFYNNVGGTQQLVAQSWCIDVTHDVLGTWGSVGNSYTFNVTAAVDNNGMSNFDNGGGTGSLISWQLLGEMGALAYWGDMHLNDNAVVSSAVQIALWDLEYGTNIKVTVGNQNVANEVALLLSEVESGKLGFYTNVSWLHACTGTGNSQVCNQGQLIVNGLAQVPEPSSLAILGAGLLGLGGVSAFRCRRKVVKQA